MDEKTIQLFYELGRAVGIHKRANVPLNLVDPSVQQYARNRLATVASSANASPFLQGMASHLMQGGSMQSSLSSLRNQLASGELPPDQAQQVQQMIGYLNTQPGTGSTAFGPSAGSMPAMPAMKPQGMGSGGATTSPIPKPLGFSKPAMPKMSTGMSLGGLGKPAI